MSTEKILRTLDDDGSLHFSHLKKMALSPRQYLAAVNEPFDPTRAMLIGTIVHFLVLGPRPNAKKPLVKFEGERRQGKTWDAFLVEHDGCEIATAPEWREAEQVAEAVQADPIARARLDGARYETPLTWVDGGIRCSTDGVDIITPSCAVGELKSTSTTQPDAWARHAFKMLYPMQMAWYQRGARANGVDTRGGLFVLGVETKSPYECVDLELTESMVDYADRTISLWLERLRVVLDACPEPRRYLDWPGYAQTSVPWDLPPWEQDADDEDGEGVAA